MRVALAFACPCGGTMAGEVNIPERWLLCPDSQMIRFSETCPDCDSSMWIPLPAGVLKELARGPSPIGDSRQMAGKLDNIRRVG